MVDCGHQLSHATEPLAEAGLLEQRGQQELHRDRTAENLVDAAPHVAHAAAGDAVFQPVALA
jgi:hypothetical protein